MDHYTRYEVHAINPDGTVPRVRRVTAVDEEEAYRKGRAILRNAAVILVKIKEEAHA